MSVSFRSDYMEGAHERIMDALIRTNREQTTGYGEDAYCEEARKLIKQYFVRDETQVHFLVGGTQTNATVIDAVLKPYQGVVCADTGHIAVHESGAVEACGHKVLTLPNTNGKISAAQVEAMIRAHYADESFEHMVQPGMIYISQPTEVGTIYSKAELTDLRKVCDRYQIPLYVDGARLGSALMCSENDVSLEDLEALADVFYIGGTKMGALFGEAVVFPNPRLGVCFRYLIRQHGGMFAKGRLLGIQFAELFRDGLYFEIGAYENRLADKLRAGIRELGYSFGIESCTNQSFPIFPDSILAEFEGKFDYSYWSRIDPSHSMVRFCTSWATEESNVDAFLEFLKAITK